MINTTTDEVVFNKTGPTLHSEVITCLKEASSLLLLHNKLTEVDFDKISTKTNPQALFSKLVFKHLLANKTLKFDESYVSSAYKLFQNRTNKDLRSLIYKFLGVSELKLDFRMSYTVYIPRGVGLFLVALHSSGVITLPITFNWPTPSKTHDLSKLLASELLSFIRTLETQNDDIPDLAFSAVGTAKKRREWFGCYGTKLLLATGWHSPKDVNVDDIVKLKFAVDDMDIGEGVAFPFSLLIDVLWRKYENKIDLSPEAYKVATKSMVSSNKISHAIENRKKFSGGDSTAYISLDSVILHEASDGFPEAIRAIDALPGLNIDLSGISSTWLTIQDAYLKNLKRESKKGPKLALGWLNVYLFMYLPYWFEAHSNTKIKYPSSPEFLTGSIFISRLIDIDFVAPETFMTMMNTIAEKRSWIGNSYYSTVKQVELFFAFIQKKSEALPGCNGFRQPLSKDDFPPTTSQRNTNKRPIEKRLFGVTLNLVEVLITYSEVITDRILDGNLNSHEFQLEISRFGRVIDTFQVAHLTGVIPLIFYRGKTIPLRIVPNCLSFTNSHKLKQFETGVQIPSPHGLNQIYVALHTGLRHNHIQWLDARSFDKCVSDESSEFTQLLVNTDKRKNKPWMPYVSMCVIERLRAQRRWRNLFDEPGYLVEHNYNDNSDTKWAPIQPLFSMPKSGLPHTDMVYTRIWGLLLSMLQGLLRELGEESYLPIESHGKLVPRIGMLEPGYVGYNDPDAVEKRKKAGNKIYKHRSFVPLEFKSPMSAHSTRVTVVQQYMTYLTAEYVGKYFTGQTPRTVHYYHIPDSAELAREGVFQAMSQRGTASKDLNLLLGAEQAILMAVRADSVQSRLAESLRLNLSETIEAYGFVSLSLADSEVSGIEVLQKTMGVDAVLNKTEICPYGNRCPTDVIKLLKYSHRCGLCPYAVRSVDHLHAVSAKLHQVNEELSELESKLKEANLEVTPRFTEAELDALEITRSDLSEDITGWLLNEEVLDHTLQRLKSGQSKARWVVQAPEAVERDLRRVTLPSNVTAYTLARLQECIAFPTLESPQIRARFELLRRQLLAKSGKLAEALSSKTPTNPAMECAGLLKTIVEAHKLNYNDVVRVLESDLDSLGISLRENLLILGGD